MSRPFLAARVAKLEAKRPTMPEQHAIPLEPPESWCEELWDLIETSPYKPEILGVLVIAEHSGGVY